MITAIIQARMGSSRLPGKVMKVINGHPMLHYTINSLEKSPLIAQIILVTTTLYQDDALVDYVRAFYKDIMVIRGDKDNVLSRFLIALRWSKNDYILRATGDNPITDYNNPTRLYRHLMEWSGDYATECRLPTGVGFELFRKDLLPKLNDYELTNHHLEHVTLFIKENREKFKTQFPFAPSELHSCSSSFTVDTEEQLQYATRFITRYYPDGEVHCWRDAWRSYINKGGLL
jgi:spore coat polysaccharide biosynthesis protein SpsF (cytidylyltransferase family)